MTARRRKRQQSEGGNNIHETATENTSSEAGKAEIDSRAKDQGVAEVEVAWSIEGPTRIVRNLAIYRFILFGILIQEYVNYLPHEAWPERYDGLDTWFTYDQFEFLYDWAPKRRDPLWGESACALLFWMGIAAGTTAALGGIPRVAFSFELAGMVMIALYAFRFFVFVQFFTNHNYLFLLLSILVVVSGGGSYYPPTYTENRPQRLRWLIQKSEWGAIMIRIQYAVVYFYASIWKMTPDWVDGSICKGIFLTFQEQGVNRGIDWQGHYKLYGAALFRVVAMGGLILDTGMFLALTVRRPNRKTTKLFTVLSIMFHGFVCFTMSQRIGYTFPLCCLAGSLIFQPIGNDDVDGHRLSKKDDDYSIKKNDSKCNENDEQETEDEGNLVEWIYRYCAGSKAARASTGQRYFALFWTMFQLGMPMRMPIISGGTFPFTGRCYRFSWTMMLHSRNTFITHKGFHSNPDGTLSDRRFYVVIDMTNLYPECADVVPITRQMYQSESIYRHSDPRTMPLIPDNHGIIQMRQRALIDQFPRHVARIAGGWSEHYFQRVPEACRNPATGEMRRISVYGVVFSRINGKGAYSRIFDPTVNLAEVEQVRKRQSFWQTLRGVVLDQAPPGYEYFLMRGIGSMKRRAADHKKQLSKLYPDAKQIVLIADRAACLAARPLSLWPSGFPLAVTALEVPDSVELRLSRRRLPEGTAPENQWKDLSEPEETTLPLRKLVRTSETMIEFTINKAMDLGDCGETAEEDLLFALLFME